MMIMMFLRLIETWTLNKTRICQQNFVFCGLQSISEQRWLRLQIPLGKLTALLRPPSRDHFVEGEGKEKETE